jgi:hypothetical protein
MFSCAWQPRFHNPFESKRRAISALTRFMASINHDNQMEIRVINGTEMVLLWLAISLAVLFIGVLIFDQFRRRKRGRRPGEPRGGLRAALRRTFRQLKILRQDLKAMALERSRRKERGERKRLGTKR